LLLNNKKLNENGYGQFELLDINTFSNLEDILTQYISHRLSSYQEVPSDFELRNYHKYLKKEENHYKISTWALDIENLGSVYHNILAQVESILGLKLKTKEIEHLGQLGHFIGFRIVRPLKNDHNPFHRDAWIPYWQDTINVWLPICGFEDGNGLQLIPKSHLWNDNEILKTKSGVEMNGKKYHVAAAIGSLNSFNIETPVLKQGDGLIFSPYLVHGNGVNKNSDVTRTSIEFRFCKA
jgi:ectoine hydroxylase-related dioxygenase (phytanoyl-CoA dioxygenase family)